MRRFLRAEWILLAIALAIPVFDQLLPARLGGWRIGDEVCSRVLIFAIMALGLNIVVGYTGLLHLGVAAFMAIGVYAYAILTCNIYPFQMGFWGGLVVAPLLTAAAGLFLGAPTLRLRGDYLAIVTLGFGEITKEAIKNLESITQGTQGINPLPSPVLPGYAFESSRYEPWYFLYLAVVVGLVFFCRNLERSRVGRQWMTIREDELAATCMGVNPTKTKLLAFAVAAGICGLAGVLWAAKLKTTADPNAYDFNISISVLAILIVGGLGSLRGVLAGTAIVMGFDILLGKVTYELQRQGVSSSASVFLTPTNWKFLVYGLALVIMMRFRPEGIFPSTRIREELHEEPAPGATP
jgi:branched-chain amino acid transport system permease protein